MKAHFVFLDPSMIQNVQAIILLLDYMGIRDDVLAAIPHTVLTEDVRVLLELGLGVQTDHTVHMVLLMQDIAEKHGNHY